MDAKSTCKPVSILLLLAVLLPGSAALFVPVDASAQVRAALVRDMDSPIRGTRFSERHTFNFNNGSFSANETITLAVPAGKRLFLQSVSTHTLLTDGQGIMEYRLTVGSDAESPRFWIEQVTQAAGTQQRHFTGNLALNILLNVGESISLFVFRNDNLGDESLNFGNLTVIGYLVDANP